MITFIKHENGRINSVIKVPDELPNQYPDYISTDVPNVSVITHYVSDGKVISLPSKPSDLHKFNYTTKQWELDTELAWQQVRNQRNNLLVKSDWTQLPDVPLASKEVWAVYRQALRDITEQADPLNIVWPVAP